MKKRKIIILFILLFTVIFLFTDIYRVLLIPLDVNDEVPSCFGDLIIVPGGGLRKGLKPGYSTEERLRLAAELYRKRKCRILVSDGSLYRKSPAIPVLIKFMENLSVNRNDLILEGASQTTVDNFRNIRDIIRGKGFKEIIVCTSPYHQKRCRLIMDSLGYRNYRIPEMKNSELISPDSTGRRLRNWKLIVREYFALLKYFLK